MKLEKKILAVTLILVNFLLLHYVVSSLPIRFDFTSEDRYSLSDSSKSLLSKIEDPITLDFYYTKSNSELSIGFKNFANRVEQMLKQYAKASGGKLKLNVIDPEPDSTAEESAVAAGLHGQEVASGDRVFLGLAASQADTEKNIPFFNPQKEATIEYDVSKLIYEVQLLTKPTLGLITSLPLKAPPVPPQMMQVQRPPADQYVMEQLESTFNVEIIEATNNEIPSGIDLLAIIHPQGLSEGILFDIDQHILRGKPLFIAVDPSSIFYRSQPQQQQMMGRPAPNVSSDFERLFDAWGLEYDASQVLLDSKIAYSSPGNIQPAWLIFEEANRNSELLPLTDLDPLLFLEMGFLKLSDDSALSFDPAFESTTEAGQTAAMMLQFMQGGQLIRQLEPKNEAFAVGGMLTGEFVTAFPNGKPQSPEEATTNAEITETSDPEHLTSGEGNVFVLADTDWILDQFSIQRMNFLGMNAIQPLNGNQTFVSNMLDYLGGSRDLIGIRGKSSTQRNYDVVQQMEKEAQVAYQNKLQEMENKRSTIQQQIQEIASKQQGSGLIVASPELQESLQKFREQEAELGRSIREIRRNMRSDIKRLGKQLGAINLLYAPIGLLLFALLFFKARKQSKI